MNKSNSETLVTILTPVYNGEQYLQECIDSILAQTYQNWEYFIVNNCSTDQTLAIAEAYAKTDKRIKVVTNKGFVGVIENHNNAFALVTKNSKYCKVVSADDWLYPECLSKMVGVAEQHPTVGIVGCYQFSGGKKIRWQGLPTSTDFIPGHEVCRLNLLNHFDVSGDPTNSLYRSDLVRNNQPFYRHNWPYADTSAFYHYLQLSDFGFVHENLCVERIHAVQETNKAYDIGMSRIAYLDVLLTYGPTYLHQDELEAKKNAAFTNYWNWLGAAIFKLKGPRFWKFHSSRLKELGYHMDFFKVFKGFLNEIGEEMQNPTIALKKFKSVLKLTLK